MDANDREKRFGKTRVRLELADITTLRVEAVVNAANSGLMGGAGVDGAIHFAGGPQILKECKAIISRIGRLEPGRAVATTAGNLPADYVIHTVGPIWRGGKQQEPEILASCYASCLAKADELKLKTVAFPSISTGAYGYPVLQASEVAVSAVKRYLERESTQLEEVVFSLFSHEDLGAYRRALGKAG